MLHPNRKMVSVIMERIKPKEMKADDGGMSPREATQELTEKFTDAEPDDYEESEKEAACIEAADDILMALQENDARKLHEALSQYLQLAKGY